MNKNESKTVIEHSSIVHACTNLLTFILRITMSTDTTANNKRIAKNSIYMSIRMVIVLLINLYTSRVLLKTLGVEDYGVYNVVAGFVMMFTFLNASLSNGIQRFYNFHLGIGKTENVNMVFNCAMLIQSILALLIVLPAEGIGTWYIQNKMVLPEGRLYAAQWIFHLAIITFVIHIIQVPYNAAVMAHERMDFYAFANIFYTILILVGVWMLPLINNDSLILYGGIILFSATIQIIAYIYYCKKQFKEIYFIRRLDRKMIKEMTSFSGWNIFGTIGQMLKDQGVNLILNLFFGPIVNAARAVAYQVNSGFQSFVANIAIPIRPQVVQSYAQENYHRAYNLTFTTSKMSCFALLMMALPVTFEIDYILRIWLGDNIPQHTSIFIILVIIDSFLLNLNSAISTIVHASGKMKTYQLCGGMVSIISVICVYFVISIFNISELAFVTLIIGDIIRQVIALFVLKKIDENRLSLVDYSKNVIIPLLSVGILSLILPVSIRYFIPQGLFRFVVVIITSLLSVVTFIYFFGLSQSEKQLFNPIVSKIANKIFRKK